jgi:hypothetical protein
MSEKLPLIPVAEPQPHVQSRCKGRSIRKLVTATAAAALIYYGIPYGTLAIDLKMTLSYFLRSWKEHCCA